MLWVAVRLGEPLLAAVAAGLLYVGLYGELPYHDVARFAGEVNSGQFKWDIGHIFLQPATLMWHLHLGFGEPAEASQRHINSFATALGIGVFYALLQRLATPGWLRVAAVLLVMTSCSLIILAPSGHMKLLAFPFVNAALFVLVGWERRPDQDRRPRSVIIGACLLALAASFLASALATAPFASLAVLLVRRRSGVGWSRAMASGVLFATVCGALFLALAGAGYAVFAGGVPDLQGLAGSIAFKAGEKPPGYNLTADLARLLFGTVNNLIAAPDLGPVIRAWLGGAIPSLAPYARQLAVQGLPWLATGALVAAIYLRTACTVLAARSNTEAAPIPCLLPLAFLCGAQSWTIYYGLNDPEHWFQLTVPTVILFLLLFPANGVRRILPPWAVITALINVVTFAMPYAAYPLHRYETQLRGMFAPRDLVISFAAYSGGPSPGFISLPGVPRLVLDNRLHEAANPAAFYAGVAQDIAAAFARGGRVVVIGNVLDPTDWNAPWGDLPALGVSKQGLRTFFETGYRVTRLDPLAEMPAWDIRPHDDTAAQMR